MRKKYLYFGIIIVLLGALLCYGIHSASRTTDDSDIEKISSATCAKFESRASTQEIFITSEIFILSQTFSSLDLVETRQEPSDWIWRITFNCSELRLDDTEIIVEISDESLSVNGKMYTTPEEVPFSHILDLMDGKFAYFSSRYSDTDA